MPAIKSAPSRKSFVLEKPPTPELFKLRLIQGAIHRNIKKEKQEEILRKKKEEEERIKREKAKEELDMGVVVEEMKEVIEPQMDPEEQLKALEQHLEELNEQKHKLFLLLKQILNEDEKRRQAQEAEKRKQLERQRAAELAQYPNGKPESIDSPTIGRDGTPTSPMPTPKAHSGPLQMSSQQNAQPQQPQAHLLGPRPSGNDHLRKPHMAPSASPNHASPQRHTYYPPPMLPGYYPPPVREPIPPVGMMQPYYTMPAYAIQQMQIQQMGLLGHNPYSRMMARSAIPPTPIPPMTDNRILPNRTASGPVWRPQ